MIKICALDFLNKETFETNVLTEDGSVLAETGEKITPGLLLKLYFKTIYVERELEESPVKIISAIKDEEIAEAKMKDITEPVVSQEKQEDIEPTEFKTEVLSEQLPEEQELETIEAVEEEVSAENVEKLVEIEQQKTVETEVSIESTDSIEKAEDVEIQPENVVIGGEKEETLQSAEISTVEESIEKVEEKAAEAEAEAVSLEESEDKASVPSESKEIKEKGPQKVSSSTEVHEEKQTETKGPRILDSTEQPAKTPEEKKIYGQQKAPEPEPEPEPEPINPDEVPLKFSEAQAKNIVESSLAMGKMLNYSAKELKELEQVAYYSNIGIGKLKQGDINKKSFRKMKAFASYQKLIDEGTVSTDIADIVKYTANEYESDAFPLASKIPYHHVVAITGYYEDMLLKGKSKNEILLKMLELGGNHFNVFVLHKFINYMKEKQ